MAQWPSSEARGVHACRWRRERVCQQQIRLCSVCAEAQTDQCRGAHPRALTISGSVRRSDCTGAFLPNRLHLMPPCGLRASTMANRHWLRLSGRHFAVGWMYGVTIRVKVNHLPAAECARQPEPRVGPHRRAKELFAIGLPFIPQWQYSCWLALGGCMGHRAVAA